MTKPVSIYCKFFFFCMESLEFIAKTRWWKEVQNLLISFWRDPLYQLQISPSFVMIQVTIQSRLKILADIFELLVLHSKYSLEHTNMAFKYLFVIADIKWYRTVYGSMVHGGYLWMLGHQLLSKAWYCGRLLNTMIQFPYLSSVRNIIALTKFIASHPKQCVLEYKIKSRFLM